MKLTKLLFVYFVCFFNVILNGQNSNSLGALVKQCDPAIVKIYTYNKNGDKEGQGSGCIINKSGVVITNLHVITGATTVQVELSNKKTYNLKTILDYNVESDLVLFQLNSTELFSIVEIDNTHVTKGDDVFSLGYPSGFNIEGESTLSTGIISGSRIMENVPYIQTTTPFTHGSSGGGLFNYKGKLIGITTGTFATEIKDRHANLNKVVPASEILKLKRKLDISLESFNDILLEKSILAEANYYYDNLEFLKAYGLYIKYIKNDITNALIWHRMGVCSYFLYRKHLDATMAESAEWCFLNSIELDENFFYSHGQLAKFYMFTNQIEKAKKHAFKCYELAPNELFAIYVMASYYGNQNVKNTSKALELYDKIIAIKLLEPNSSQIGESYFERGIVKMNANIASCVDDFKTCLFYNPNHLKAIWYIAVYYLNNKRFKESCPYLYELYKKDPNGLYDERKVSAWINMFCK